MVNRDTLRLDVMAGLTGAIVVLPQGVAFAVIAGMPPEYGLYTAMIPAIIAAMFGSSWHLVSGPTTAASLVLFASLSTLAEPTTGQYVALAITLTFMVGLTQIATLSNHRFYRRCRHSYCQQPDQTFFWGRYRTRPALL